MAASATPTGSGAPAQDGDTPQVGFAAAVVLAGGSGRRLGGIDKPALRVGGRSLLERVLAAVGAAGSPTAVVVGPHQAVRTPVPLTWAREEPAGGGPVAALGAGLAALPGPLAADRQSVVAVLAGDLPFVSATALRALAQAVGPRAGAVLVDGDGRAQWLLGAWRLPTLAAAVAASPARGGGGRGVALRSVLAGLGPALVAVAAPPDGAPPWLDCDDPADLEAARRWAAREQRLRTVAMSTLEEWTERVGAELDLAQGLLALSTRDTVLDLARDVAHGVARPAAPLTTFLLGVAAGRSGATDSAAVSALAARVTGLLAD